ncbi:MAG: TolC family protein [Acidobacteriaceae bacterium]|nr:TolC family protein [Acidobacteriaceae bacterium]
MCLLSLMAAGTSAEELALDEAVHLALQHNTEIANTALDVSKANDRYAAFHTSIYPKFSVYAFGSQQLQPITATITKGSLGTYNIIGPLPANNVAYTTPMQPTGLILGSVKQPLLTLYRIHLNLDALKTNTQITAEKARSKRQEVVRNVKQLYYTIEQVQSSLAVTREAIVLYKETERLTSDYVAKQTALESELLQAQASLADAEQSELNLSNQEAKAKEQLNDLLGRDVLTEFDVTAIDAAHEPVIDLVAARKEALVQRPELKQAQLKVVQSEQELRAKRAEYIPDLSAEFNSVSLLNFSSFLPNGSYSVGLSLSWEPFDWGRKKYEIAEKKDTVTQDKNTESSTERKVIMDVDDKYRQIQQSWAKLHTADVTQRYAKENLRVSNNQYKVQAALLKVVFQAQTTLAQANSDYQHALADFWTAQAEFEYALGEDQ